MVIFHSYVNVYQRVSIYCISTSIVTIVRLDFPSSKLHFDHGLSYIMLYPREKNPWKSSAWTLGNPWRINPQSSGKTRLSQLHVGEVWISPLRVMLKSKRMYRILGLRIKTIQNHGFRKKNMSCLTWMILWVVPDSTNPICCISFCMAKFHESCSTPPAPLQALCSAFGFWPSSKAWLQASTHFWCSPSFK